MLGNAHTHLFCFQAWRGGADCGPRAGVCVLDWLPPSAELWLHAGTTAETQKQSDRVIQANTNPH